MTDQQDDDFSVDTPELAECALINFKNAQRMMPALQGHPIFQLALQQLEATVARLKAELDAA